MVAHFRDEHGLPAGAGDAANIMWEVERFLHMLHALPDYADFPTASHLCCQAKAMLALVFACKPQGLLPGSCLAFCQASGATAFQAESSAAHLRFL